MPIYHNGKWLDELPDSVKVPRAEYPAPTINTQPVGAGIFAGATHDLSVVAASNLPHDPALTYQWYQGVLGDGTDWVAIAGATAATYTYTGVASDPAGLKFVCNVHDSRGQVAQTTVATMTIYAAVTCSIAMTPASVVEGGALTFTATAGGGNGSYTYQWYLGGVAIGGATANPYVRTTVLADNGGVITCVATSAGQASPASNGATMVVEAAIIWEFDTVATSFATASCSDANGGFRVTGSVGSAFDPPGFGRTAALNVVDGQTYNITGTAQSQLAARSNVFSIVALVPGQPTDQFTGRVLWSWAPSGQLESQVLNVEWVPQGGETEIMFRGNPYFESTNNVIFTDMVIE